MEKYEKDGMAVDYYVQATKTAVMLLHSHYLSSTYEETGFSKMRDLLAKKVLDAKTLVKLPLKKNSPRRHQ